MRQHGNRTNHRRGIAVVVACLTVAAVLGACGDDGESSTAGAPAEPSAGGWMPWVLASPTDVNVLPPPARNSPQAKAELAEVKRLAGERTPEVRQMVDRWNGPLPTQPWTDSAYTFVSRQAKNPPLSSRNYALVHVAMYDAVIAAYHWKYQYRRDAPDAMDTLVPAGADPSYPSEHAAIAGAASRVLAFLYPNESALRLDEMAEEAARSRVQAGVNTSSDVSAGLELGRGVADKVIAYAKTDGAGTPWDGRRPPGIGRGPAFWEPPPGAVSPPIEPMAATWKTWVMTTPNQFRPPPPPAFGTPEFRAAGQELIEIRKNMTPDQERIARFWEGAEGSKLPAGITLETYTTELRAAATSADKEQRLSVPRVARALALATVAMADAGVAAWDAKFTYWNPRPINGIRDSGLDPNWTPLLDTPRFPAYPSGSAGYAGSAEVVMTYLFPEQAEKFKARAEEQAMSRLYAGIHWRYDSVSLDAGRNIGNLVVERAKGDGADRR